MGTGPIYLAAGILTAVAAYRRSDLHGIYVGCSAIALAIGLFGLIFVNGWGPAEADLPVSIILWVYAVIVIPMLVYLIMARDKTPLSSSPLLKNSEKPV